MIRASQPHVCCYLETLQANCRRSTGEHEPMLVLTWRRCRRLCLSVSSFLHPEAAAQQKLLRKEVISGTRGQEVNGCWSRSQSWTDSKASLLNLRTKHEHEDQVPAESCRNTAPHSTSGPASLSRQTFWESFRFSSVSISLDPLLIPSLSLN